MTALEKIREWIATYPGYEALEGFHVDYTDQRTDNGGIYPSGLVEIERKTDILGNVTVENQLNFSISTVFAKAEGDDVTATNNAEWVADFQQWVQEQSATGKAPVFGDVPRAETITAQNGMMFDTDEGRTALYTIQLSVTYTKNYWR